MDFLEKNLSVIPDLAKLYLRYQNELYPLEPAKSGEMTVRLKNIYLHSKYDPVKEAQRVADLLMTDRENIDVLILYGCGLGYVARILFRKLIEESGLAEPPYILYIEADTRLYFTALQCYDWSRLLSHDHFKLFLEADKVTIGSFIQNLPTKRIRYYYHRPTYSIFETYYREIQQYIAYILDRKDMNTATFSRFQKIWTRNFIYNLPVYFKTRPVKALAGIAQGALAAVVAGGPNLERCLSYLDSIKDRAIIIAVDTVYKYLVNHGILPDIIVTVDPQFWNYKFLENALIPPTTLIVAESSTYHRIFQLTQAANYFIGSSIFPVVKYFEENNAERGTLLAGGSVATTAFDLARIIGAAEIVLLGLDLSYPRRMTHFKGAYFEINFLNTSTYYHTAEHASYSYLTYTGLKTVLSTGNTPVFTDQKMILFKKWFDREISLTNAKVYLPDLGGVLLDGALISDLNNLPQPDRQAKQSFTKAITILLQHKQNQDPKKILAKIRLILNKATEIKKMASSITGLIPENGIPDLIEQKKIQRLEAELMANPDRAEITRMISASAQDILISIIENFSFDTEEKTSAWIKTRLLYQSIHDLTVFFEKSFSHVLKVYFNQPKININK